MAAVLACAASPAAAQWAPVFEDDPPEQDDPLGPAWIEDEEEDERSPPTPRVVRTGARVITASVFGGYLGLSGTEGRGLDAYLGHGARVGLEPFPFLPIEIAYVGGRRKSGTDGISSTSWKQSLLLTGGWQHHEQTAVFAVGGGLAFTRRLVTHRWMDEGALEARRFDLEPALLGALKTRTDNLEIRLDIGFFRRQGRLDVLVSFGVGIATGGSARGRAPL